MVHLALPSLSEFRDAASKAEGNLRDISVIAPSFTNLETKGCHPVPQEQLCDAQNAKWMLASKSLLQRGGKRRLSTKTTNGCSALFESLIAPNYDLNPRIT